MIFVIFYTHHVSMDKAIKYNSTKQNQELKLCDVCLTNMDTRHIVIECKKTECERNTTIQKFN